MEARLLVIKKILDTLGVPTSIETVSDRIRLQKAMYFAQRAGIDLGYNYGWYRRGPYSPRLTRDYYELQDALALAGGKAESANLVGSATGLLNTLRPMMQVPSGVPLKPHLWLELLAAVDYLENVTHMSEKESDELLEKEKPRLAPYASAAREQLRTATFSS